MPSSEAPESPLPRPSRRSAWFLALLCLVAVGLRLVVLQQFEARHPLADYPAIDERSYDAWGAEIAAGDWLGDEVFFQEPLYPYFLGGVYALLGHDLHRARLVQCLLGGLTVLLLWELTRRVFGERAAWFSASGFALYPPALLLPCLLLKPNLFLPLFTGLALLLVGGAQRGRGWLAAGVLAGLGALLRGNLLILLPLLVLWPVARRRGRWGGAAGGWRRAGLFAAGAALVLLPVALRNHHVGGVLALTTSGAGTNVFGGNNADNPYGVATEFPWVRGIPRYEAGDWRREAERRTGRELDLAESSSYWLGQVVESVRADPGLHLGILWNKLRLALDAYEVPDNHHIAWDRRYVPLLRLRWPGFGLLGGLGLAGLVLIAARRRLHGGGLDLAILFALYLGTIVATVVSMRARLPVVIPLAAFAGSYIDQLLELLRGPAGSRRPGLAASWVALGALGISVVSSPVFDDGARARDIADRDHNLAVSLLQEQGDVEGAAELARELCARYPETSRFQTLLATTEWRRGRQLLGSEERRAGEELVRSAVARLRPIVESETVSPRERSRALRLAGYVQADLGNWSAAERFFRQAREFAGEDLELMVSHAQALLESEGDSAHPDPARTGEAEGLLREVLRREPDSFEAAGARRLLEEFRGG